jgi:cation-transporting P-type ATPase 13A2
MKQIAVFHCRRLVFGDNLIDVAVKGWLTLLFLEALNPFYVFQVFSVILWFTYNYYTYACVIILMTAFGIFFSIQQTLKNQKALHATVFNTDTAVVKQVNGTSLTIDTNSIVRMYHAMRRSFVVGKLHP